MKLATVLLSIVLLSGCATIGKYNKKLESSIGSTELNLINAWGVPQNVYETGGSKFFVYVSSGTTYFSGTNPSYTTSATGNTISTTPTQGRTGMAVNQGCETTFEISDDRVRSWRWQGNNCRSR
jgi:hypothetical protein